MTQALLPWGIKSVRQVDTEPALGEALVRLTTNSLIAYSHPQVFVFLAVKPASYYNLGRYFGLEFLSQVGVGALMVALLILTESLLQGERLAIVALAALMAVLAIDAQYWHWWGFGARYSLDVAVNRLLGQAGVAFILLQLFF